MSGEPSDSEAPSDVVNSSDEAEPSDAGERGITDRRKLLQALGGLGATGLAGCPLSSDDPSTDTPTATDEPTDETTDDGETPTGRATETDVPSPTDFEPSVPDDPAVLVLSATAEFRHDSIEVGNRAIEELADEIASDLVVDSVAVDVIDDPNGDSSEFPADAAELDAYDAVVWNNTTGSVLDADQQTAFREFIQSGGGFVGIHAAADTHYDWDWYGDLVGAQFDDHPRVQTGRVNVTDRAHPSTAHLPAVWEGEDEWYDYGSNPRGDVHVLATLDEDSYEGATMRNGRADHPIAWCHPFDGGRAWYTGRGHTAESFAEDAYREHVRQGIMWAAGYIDGDASGTIWDSYEMTELETGLEQPIAIDVAHDGRVFYVERGGRMAVIEDGETSTVLEMDVYFEQEDGLVGMVLAPEFESTGWVYLYYSPPNDEVGDAPYNQLSRFTVEGDSIDPATEVEILRVETQRETCCHTGGAMQFDADGNLYLTTGDDTDPFESNGYAPLDEREDRAFFDAQRTAANTADLRGKILRITPHEDGTYAVPDDNLFTEARGYADEFEAALVREEIYVMGCRNPYTAAIDDETGWLYFGDYGPDAERWSDDQGPPGIVEFNQAREAGNYGWPYCVGPSLPYRAYDFETEEPGAYFDPDGPVNDSPNNTGLDALPPCEDAMLFYPKDWRLYLDAPNDVELPHEDVPHPSLPAGGAPTAGPVFHHEEGYADTALPEFFEGKHFIAEWGENWLKYVSFDDDDTVIEVDPFLPNQIVRAPIDMAVGPDGAFYLLEFGGWEGTDGTRISRIEHTW